MPAWCWVARAVRVWYYLHHVTWPSMSRWGKLPQNKREWTWWDVGLKFWATRQSESKLIADYNVSVPEVTLKSDVICFLNAARCGYSSSFFCISMMLFVSLLLLCRCVSIQVSFIFKTSVIYCSFSWYSHCVPQLSVGSGCICVFIFRVKTTQPCCESTRQQWAQNITQLQHQ